MTVTDKWSCPRCRHTVTFNGPPKHIAGARTAEQKQHGKTHRKEAAQDRKLRRLDLRRETAAVTRPA